MKLDCILARATSESSEVSILTVLVSNEASYKQVYVLLQENNTYIRINRLVARSLQAPACKRMDSPRIDPLLVP